MSCCCRSEKSNPGFHESVFCALQALRNKEFSIFDETLKQARCGGQNMEFYPLVRQLYFCFITRMHFFRGAEVEELRKGSLEAVSSLYPALRNLQSVRELESVKELFSRWLRQKHTTQSVTHGTPPLDLFMFKLFFFFFFFLHQTLLRPHPERSLQPVAAPLSAPRWQWLCFSRTHPSRPLCGPAHPVVQGGRARQQPVPQLCSHWPSHGLVPVSSQGRKHTGNIHRSTGEGLKHCFPFIYHVNIIWRLPLTSIQLAERAVYQMKQHAGGGRTLASLPVSSWQLEEAQVFWAKGEQGLALGLLRQMIHSLEKKVRRAHNAVL